MQTSHIFEQCFDAFRLDRFVLFEVEKVIQLPISSSTFKPRPHLDQNIDQKAIEQNLRDLQLKNWFFLSIVVKMNVVGEVYPLDTIQEGI